MTKIELEQYLMRLDLSAPSAAQLLGVTPRTVQRWLDGDEIAGPAEQAILAWIKLHDIGIPWRPDSRSLANDDQKAIAAHRRHAVDLAALIRRVEARGGPRMPWTVDHSRNRAVCGKIELSFYDLQNGAFSLANYTRRDMPPDLSRDAELIDDAAYSIAKSFMKKLGPATLAWTDASPKSGSGRPAKAEAKKFSSSEAALEFACKHMEANDFYEPFIFSTENSNLIVFDKHQLRQECERRRSAPVALAAVADYTRNHSSCFVTSGPVMLTPAVRAAHERHIEVLADEMDALAEKAGNGSANYQQFNALLGKLHAANFFPDGDLVSAAMRSLIRNGAK